MMRQYHNNQQLLTRLTLANSPSARRQVPQNQ